MSYQAWSDTPSSQHTNTTAKAGVLLLVRATEATSSWHKHTRTHAQIEAGAAEQREARKTHNVINTGRAELLVCYSQNIQWSLWVSGMTCVSHPSSLESSSGRYLKASEARCALHSCSSLPQLVTSCRFPAPWVDSSFVNSERASQPAMWAVSAGPLSLPPSLTPSLFFSLCFYPAVLALPRSHCPLSLSLSLGLSLFLLLLLDAVWSNDSGSNRFTLPSSSCCLSRCGETTLTSIKAMLLLTRAREEKRRMATARKQEGAEARDGRGERWGLKESVDREERV